MCNNTGGKKGGGGSHFAPYNPRPDSVTKRQGSETMKPEVAPEVETTDLPVALRGQDCNVFSFFLCENPEIFPGIAERPYGGGNNGIKMDEKLGSDSQKKGPVVTHESYVGSATISPKIASTVSANLKI